MLEDVLRKAYSVMGVEAAAGVVKVVEVAVCGGGGGGAHGGYSGADCVVGRCSDGDDGTVVVLVVREVTVDYKEGGGA